MTIPFLHHTAAALYIGEDRLTWVVGSRLGRRLRRLEVVHEAVEGGSVQAALERLVARVQPAHPYVVTHLHPLHIRHAVLQGPAFDDLTAFEAWLDAEALRLLPPRASLDDFIQRCVLLEESEEHTRCLLALASRKAVEERTALLDEVGLIPLRIRSADVAAIEALSLHPAVAEGRTALLVLRPEDTVLLQLQDGLPYAMTPLPYGTRTTDLLPLLEEVGALLPPGADRLFAIGQAASELGATARAAPSMDLPVHDGTLDLSHLGMSIPIPPDEIPMAALALQDLFPALGAIDFLDLSTSERHRQAVEKREATRAILALGSLIGALFLILTLLGTYLNGKKTHAEAVLQALSDQIERMEAAHETVAQLEREVRHAERLVVERTDVAGLLDGVGRAIADDLWLDAATLEDDEAGTLRLTLTGAAFSKRDLAAYLDRLEQASFAANVRLLYSETIQAAAYYKHDLPGDRLLTRFEITLNPRQGRTTNDE